MSCFLWHSPGVECLAMFCIARIILQYFSFSEFKAIFSKMNNYSLSGVTRRFDSVRGQRMDLELYSDASESEPCEVTSELAEAAPNLDKAGLGRQFFCHRPSLIDHFNQRLFSLPTFLSERWSALIVDLSYLIDEHSCLRTSSTIS